MKLNQLRKIIREEVKAAVKEELQDILNEAVKVASTPTNEAKSSNVTMPKPSPTNPVATGKKSIDEMLKQTANNMTNEEYRNVFTGTSDMVTGMPNMASTVANQMNMNSGNQPGLDISNLDFVNKAKAVLDLSNKKTQVV
tara:strand:+ start:3168 stop:3587 length:420 start_codon:yes stop_codon:yes gene_type:complete